MKTFFLTIAFSLISLISFSQQISTKKGVVYDSNNKPMSKDEVRKLLASKPELLQKYNSGVAKASVGGFVLGLGLGFMAGDLVGELITRRGYPTIFTYIGAANIAIGLPITLGYEKKIQFAVDGYNSSLTTNKTSFNIEKINFITNQNGIGMQITF
jgi:hypothetical protein